MTTTCPAYEGSVAISWYPVCEVFTTRSPPAATGAPNAIPENTVPSSSARSAGPASPTRGSTIESARGSGGGHQKAGLLPGLSGPADRPHGTGDQDGPTIPSARPSTPGRVSAEEPLRRLRGRGAAWGPRRRDGQLGAEHGAAALPVRHPDPAAVLLDDPARDREPQARAARGSARGAIEPVE